MVLSTQVPYELVVNGVDVTKLAYDMSWTMEYALVDGQRPFGPEGVPVDVKEIHAGGDVWGFLVPHGLPNRNTWLAVSELLGDDEWHNVVTGINGDNDDEMDAAGRAVIADRLVRGQVKTMTDKGQL